MSQSNSDILQTQYPVMEHFYTIQGEGAHSGKAAYFIRLAGCDVGCPWCDVKESWEADEHERFSIGVMLDWLSETSATSVVITGGEPTMYDLEPLTDALRENGYQTWLETSGAYEITGKWDWVVLSPKRRKKPLESSYQLTDELKQVIVRPPDLDLAREEAEKVRSTTQLFLQPEWSREEEITPMIINFVKKNPKWRISLQTHKYMQIP